MSSNAVCYALVVWQGTEHPKCLDPRKVAGCTPPNVCQPHAPDHQGRPAAPGSFSPPPIEPQIVVPPHPIQPLNPASPRPGPRQVWNGQAADETPAHLLSCALRLRKRGRTEEDSVASCVPADPPARGPPPARAAPRLPGAGLLSGSMANAEETLEDMMTPELARWALGRMAAGESRDAWQRVSCYVRAGQRRLMQEAAAASCQGEMYKAAYEGAGSAPPPPPPALTPFPPFAAPRRHGGSEGQGV